jgi:hypothetical protein
VWLLRSVLLEVFTDTSAEADPLMSVRTGGYTEQKVFRWDLRNMDGIRELDIAYVAGTQGDVQSLAADPVRGHVYTGLVPITFHEASVDCWDSNTGTSLVMWTTTFLPSEPWESRTPVPGV